MEDKTLNELCKDQQELIRNIDNGETQLASQLDLVNDKIKKRQQELQLQTGGIKMDNTERTEKPAEIITDEIVTEKKTTETVTEKKVKKPRQKFEGFNMKEIVDDVTAYILKTYKGADHALVKRVGSQLYNEMRKKC